MNKADVDSRSWILIPDGAPVDRAERFSPLSLASESAFTAAWSSIVSEGGRKGEEEKEGQVRGV